MLLLLLLVIFPSYLLYHPEGGSLIQFGDVKKALSMQMQPKSDSCKMETRVQNDIPSFKAMHAVCLG